MRNQMKRTPAKALKSLMAMMLVLCLLVGMVPVAFAAQSAGATPDYVVPSRAKTYIQLSVTVPFFTGTLYGTGTVVNPMARTVCQLVSDDWYTGSDGKAYYSVYYDNARYNVLKSDVEADIMTEAALNNHIVNTMWKQTTYETLRKNMNLVGNIRVLAVQMALQKLGYYNGDLDGNYGNQTHNAVYKFQKANKLDADGSAGPATQPVLFALASGATVVPSVPSGGTSSGSSAGVTGTLRTISQVNLRKYGSTGSARLASVPKNINLSYTDVYTASNGVKWYQVRYAGQTGWLMGTFVKVSESSSSGSSSSSGTVAGAIGTLKSTSQVNLRKYASTGSARLASVPKNTSLSYTDTHVDSKGVTWYQVRYSGHTGWVMGTYVSVTGASSGGSSSAGSSSAAIGVVTITQPGTRVRDAADGKKTGYVLGKDSVVDLLAMPVAAGGYTWYNIRTSTGLIGWVRGDCATASIGSGSSSLPVSNNKGFVKLPADTYLFQTDTKPTDAAQLVMVPAGTVLMMYSTDTYTANDIRYCTLYYNNVKYNAVYSDVSAGIMTADAVAAHVKALLAAALPYSLKREMDLVGDVYVYALQVALTNLSYYTGKLDGDYGAGTQSAVRNFQRAAKIDVDGACGNETWTALNNMLNGLPSGGGTVAGFGQVNKVVKANWETINGGASPLFKRHTYASVMVWDDAGKEYVFNVYRWAGANHADCVPATVQDTITMCKSVGFNFDGSHPSSDALSKIKNDVANNPNYTWPDFNGNLGGKNIGSMWDRKPALVNINGTVYPASIYGYPHGFNDSSFNQSTFPSGTKFYAANSYYGMMCLHFYGSTTHGGGVLHADHEAAMNKAYNKAKAKWPELCQ